MRTLLSFLVGFLLAALLFASPFASADPCASSHGSLGDLSDVRIPDASARSYLSPIITNPPVDRGYGELQPWDGRR